MIVTTGGGRTCLSPIVGDVGCCVVVHCVVDLRLGVVCCMLLVVCCCCVVCGWPLLLQWLLDVGGCLRLCLPWLVFVCVAG